MLDNLIHSLFPSMEALKPFRWNQAPSWRRGAKTFCQLLGYGHGPEESACPLAQAAALLGQAGTRAKPRGVHMRNIET